MEMVDESLVFMTEGTDLILRRFEKEYLEPDGMVSSIRCVGR